MKRSSCWLLLGGFLFWILDTIQACGTPAVPSPHELHKVWKSKLRQGEYAEEEIRRWTLRMGDQSFVGLIVPSEVLSQALRHQEQGLEAWRQGELQQAGSRLLDAFRILQKIGATTEAAFTLYYVAEIFADSEEFSESLKWLDSAEVLIANLNCPYLEGLLHQSRGYSLWYQDRLLESLAGFGEALGRWRRIDFEWGIVASWNNLASIYEETGVWSRAEECYESALAHSSSDLIPEIAFYLHANYARFLHQRGRRHSARQQLEAARSLSHVSPDEFLILECDVLQEKECLNRLERLEGSVPSVRIERALLLFRLNFEAGALEEARRFLDEALIESRSRRLHYFTRRSLRKLGQWLEARGDFEEASLFYSQFLNQYDALTFPEAVFPFSRTASPFLDGWIRSLVAQGKWEEARLAVTASVRLRQRRAIELTGIEIWEVAFEDELELLEKSARLLAGSISDSLNRVRIRPLDETFQSTRPASFGAVNVLEVWPDGEHLYVWLDTSTGMRFFRIHYGPGLFEDVWGLVSPLYAAKDTLPPPPPRVLQRRLFEKLLGPLEKWIDSQSLLFVGHKVFEVLPVELLMDSKGRLILERFTVSYLPASVWSISSNRPGQRLMFQPHSALLLPEAKRERRLLRRYFPGVRIIESLDPAPEGPIEWLYVSTHFRINPKVWTASALEVGPQSVNLFELLRLPQPPSLLTLGVCDAGNTLYLNSPYWLGFAELFLAQGVTALILSRWALDELGSRIYLDAYDRIRKGLPVDVALSEAKRSFLHKALHRHGATAAGDHPYFWAGITYVGPPGLILQESGPWKRAPTDSWIAIIFTLLILFRRSRVH